MKTTLRKHWVYELYDVGRKLEKNSWYHRIKAGQPLVAADGKSINGSTHDTNYPNNPLGPDLVVVDDGFDYWGADEELTREMRESRKERIEYNDRWYRWTRLDEVATLQIQYHYLKDGKFGEHYTEGTFDTATQDRYHNRTYWVLDEEATTTPAAEKTALEVVQPFVKFLAELKTKAQES